MDLAEFHQQLLKSDKFAEYSLRSTFFFRKVRETKLWTAISQVGKLRKVSNSFDWSDRTSLGIEGDAWDRIERIGIDPVLIFCHPRVISEQPRLLIYYRNLAMVSLKGLNSLVSANYADVEAGKKPLSNDKVPQVVMTLNSLISIIIMQAADVRSQELSGFQFASVGASIQGSWNNEIGSQGDNAVRTVLANHLKEEIAQIVWKDDTSTDYTPELQTELIDRIDEIKVIRLKNRFHLRFASEPDVWLRDPKDRPVVAIEIKAGTDPAGALERLGAAMKSFENDRAINPHVKTVYVVMSLTKAVQDRINQGNLVNHTFALAQLLADDTTQKRFTNLLVTTMMQRD